jgi:hypothetical protein
MSAIRIQTVNHPRLYAPDQLEHATRIAERIDRGLLVLCETPRPPAPPAGAGEGGPSPG